MRKGFSLVAALIVLVIVSITVAALSKFFIGSLKVGSEVKIYKTAKEAAESVAYVVVDKLEKIDINPSELTCVNRAPECSTSNTDCTNDVVKGELADSLRSSGMNATVTLVYKCKGVYIVKVEVSKGDKKSAILFGYAQ